ncbi:MAG: hypothetical protein LBT13_05445, partial [Treponema sp.]|nr:hypothetical protein [Treponema sp.]
TGSQFPLIDKLMSAILASIILFPIAFFSIFLYTHTMTMGAVEFYGYRHFSIVSLFALFVIY